MLVLTCEEKFRLKHNGYHQMPLFLRRFIYSNLKEGIGNIGCFIVGNIFLLIILICVIRYLWSFIQLFFNSHNVRT